LQRAGVSHVVLEREGVGSSWAKRWDSFHLNTPSQINVLPDGQAAGADDTFLPRDAWLAVLREYCKDHDLPVRTGVEVRALRSPGAGYEVETNEGTLSAQNVVLCSGDQNVPLTPALSAELPDDIVQMHSERYTSPSQLPDGAVLVVGSGQSGAQIVEDLLEAGRTVWLCTSKVGRAPRRYRGRELLHWMQAIGMADHRPADVPNDERQARAAMISGTHGGHSLSLQSLGNDGARLLGRLAGVDGRTLQIGDDLLANAAVGDEGAAKLRLGLDTYIEKAGIDAPPYEPDAADQPFEALSEMAAIRRVDLDAENIRSVIWATGFGGDFSYLPSDLLDARGLPKHDDGVCQPGLYCLGLLWTRRRISALIPGAAGDAEWLVQHMRDDGRL
jgi:putative flavoprotein involved in K+ transport